MKESKFGKKVKNKILKHKIKGIDYLVQFFLIVISVLFALTINQIVETRKTNKNKTNALHAIENELNRNQAILENWIQLHQQILFSLNDQNYLDSLINIIIIEKSIKIEHLSGKNFIDEMFTDAAWTTSNSIGILSEFDFNMSRSLSEIYNLKYHIMTSSIAGITEFLIINDVNDMVRAKSEINKLRIRFKELVGQELLLNQLIEKHINNYSTHKNN